MPLNETMSLHLCTVAPIFCKLYVYFLNLFNIVFIYLFKHVHYKYAQQKLYFF